MASKVEICNAALQRVARPRITSLSDGTEEAILCNTIYDLCLEEVISSATFRSTIKRATLARTTNTPTFEYDYEYQLPVDPKCLRVLAIDSTYPNSTYYTVEDDKLLTDATTVNIAYIAMLTEADSYGPYLTRALIARIAFELSYNTTGGQGLRDRLRQDFELEMIKAQADDAVQGTALNLYISTLLEGR